MECSMVHVPSKKQTQRRKIAHSQFNDLPIDNGYVHLFATTMFDRAIHLQAGLIVPLRGFAHAPPHALCDAAGPGDDDEFVLLGVFPHGHNGPPPPIQQRGLLLQGWH